MAFCFVLMFFTAGKFYFNEAEAKWAENSAVFQNLLLILLFCFFYFFHTILIYGYALSTVGATGKGFVFLYENI